MQKNIKFENFLEKELKDPDFKAGFKKENNRLAKSVIKNHNINEHIVLSSNKKDEH